ncbi:MAG TPA: hypothetical protein VGO47_10240 [Chlamydiales bacterium]|nr:hypothetical protein [Chlamydiales bacterium]
MRRIKQTITNKNEKWVTQILQDWGKEAGGKGGVGDYREVSETEK